MLAWSPIVIQKIEIAALGFMLRKLQLNRHRAAEVAPHSHPFTQLVLFLSGEGAQLIGGRRHEAHAGDLYIIPPGVRHGYAVTGDSRPLCLVLDYETARRSARMTHRRLPQQALNELHALLTRVPTKGRPTLSDFPAIIAVIALLLEPRHKDPAPPVNPPRPLLDKVRSGLRDNRPLADIARDSGYVRDALSRRLKRDCGLNLRALRDQERLTTVQNHLRTCATIAEAARHAGFDDANYFSRWFRKQTGLTPGEWRRQ